MKTGNEDDDDVDFIRSKNAMAQHKRKKAADSRAQNESKAQAPPQKTPKKKMRKAHTKDKPSLKLKAEQEADPVDTGGSESDDDQEEDELLMKPSHYRKQEYKFEEESGEGSDFEELNVTFDHFNPKESDFSGIRQFLRDLLSGTVFDVGGLVDIIIGQSGAVGTVIKIAGEDEVYGVTSVVSLAHYYSANCIKQLIHFVLNKVRTTKGLVY